VREAAKQRGRCSWWHTLGLLAAPRLACDWLFGWALIGWL
jgi:hypothetical protein